LPKTMAKLLSKLFQHRNKISKLLTDRPTLDTKARQNINESHKECSDATY